jgi:RNA polymerase-interacting CarD/CdnL/TRCF family regulator
MPFQKDETVVLIGHGVGRIADLVNKSFGSAEHQQYYEVLTERSTVWVAVETAGTHGLRPLTERAELDRYRELLRSRPTPLKSDYHLRRLELQNRQRVGTFEAMCELVRDLAARTWHAALNDVDNSMLRQAQAGLCQEWAAADGVSLPEANSEVAALLLEGRQAWQA